MIKPQSSVSWLTLWALVASIIACSCVVSKLIEFRNGQVNLSSPTSTLPGLNDQISPKSISNLKTFLIGKPHIIGAWVTRLHFDKTTNPIIWYGTDHTVVETAMKNLAAQQLSGKGYSSDDFDRQSNQSLRNSGAAKKDIIICGDLRETNIPKLSPAITNISDGICRANIPPLSNDANLSIVVVVDVPMSDNTPESIEIRRALLQLQLDIFNRDYLNREIEIRQPSTESM